MNSGKYKLIAIDVDGTLVRADQTVAEEVQDGIQAVQEAGIRVCLATGRSLNETLPAWRQLPLAKPYEPVVVLGGAQVAECDTGRTLWHKPLDMATADAFGDLAAELELTAVAATDPWRSGADYCCRPGADIDALEGAWLSRPEITVRRVERFDEDPRFTHVLRLNACGTDDKARRLVQAVKQRFDGQLVVRQIHAPNLGLVFFEAFAAGVDKFQAVKYIAQSYRIPSSAIVAVGDDVNDIGMLTGAGLGVAMPRACQDVRDAADIVATNGLADLLQRLATGRGS